MRCAACGETRKSVTLWRQILHFGETVCCWPVNPNIGPRTHHREILSGGSR